MQVSKWAKYQPDWPLRIQNEEFKTVVRNTVNISSDDWFGTSWKLGIENLIERIEQLFTVE